jgi:lysophospholipase L1-like esterase
MSARGRFLSVLVTIVIALAGFVAGGALPAAAAPKAVQYIALGDSYAAGTAAGSYPDCQHGDGGYPALLPLGSRIELQANIACSGATTFEVIETQVPLLESDTRLVTLTVGAANLDLSGLLTACNEDPTKCEGEILMRIAKLPEVGRELTRLYAAVAEAAPRARIVVTGYPHLFEPIGPLYAAINAAIDQLNTTIELAVSVANDADINIHYVDVTEDFAGHGIFGTTPFINATGFDAFHPNALGYQAYADAISAAVPGGWLHEQKQSV